MTKAEMAKATKWRKARGLESSDFPSPEGTTGACDNVCDSYGPSMRARPFAPSGLRGRRPYVPTGSRPWLHHAVPLGLRVQPMTLELFESPSQAESLVVQIKPNLKGTFYIV